MPASSIAAAVSANPVILVMGDSLAAEYGLPRDTGWVKLMSDRLRDQKFQYSVVNASISGETSSGGRTRLPALLAQYHPAIVIVELGANDGLRGLPVPAMQANLAAMIGASQKAGAKVLLIGIHVPPNYGRQYSESFDRAYSALAFGGKVAYLPFLLDGFADRLDLFQNDRLHPVVAAQPLILDNVWPALKPLLIAR